MSSEKDFSESAEDSLEQRAEKRAEKEYQLILKKNEETRRKKAEVKKAFDLKKAIDEANSIAVLIAKTPFVLDEIDKLKKKYPFYESLFESFNSPCNPYLLVNTWRNISRKIDLKSLSSDVANLIHLELNDEEKTKHFDKILAKNIDSTLNKEYHFFITLVEIYKWIIEKLYSSSKNNYRMNISKELNTTAMACMGHVMFFKENILENLREKAIKAEAHVIFFKENILENLREKAIKAEAHIDFVKNKDYEQDLQSYAF
jgi:hypothetical protein